MIAQEFIQELLGDRFYYAFAVHNNRNHMHVHITFDSVSKEDGYKSHDIILSSQLNLLTLGKE